MFDSVATGIDAVAQKTKDAEYYLSKLCTYLKDSAEYAKNLKERLEALTSKTWTIHVVYKETKQ